MKDVADLRNDARSIFHRGVEAADPAHAIRRAVNMDGERLQILESVYDLASYSGVYVVGAGKAAAIMARAMEELLGDRVKGGVVNVKYGHGVPLARTRVNEAGHPVPDQAGLQGTEQIVRLLQGTGETDLVLCLISGGASALLPHPVEGVTLEDKQQTTNVLLQCGATIHEINAVRKHISRVKGGGLARFAFPSTVVSLMLSDVIGDDLGTIGSGPTVPDKTTFHDCLAILNKYGIKQRVPLAVVERLERGERGLLEETPKAGDPIFGKTQNVIVGNNFLALDAARQKARELGYHCLILASAIQGETKDVAKVHAAVAREILATDNPTPKPACVISGGETTVTLRGNGLGGRNQEFVLEAALGISGLESVVILSGGTDGTDGPTDAAGAIADGRSVGRAQAAGMDASDYLKRNDSYHFFQGLGDLLSTGPTLTNVMDLRLVLVG